MRIFLPQYENLTLKLSIFCYPILNDASISGWRDVEGRRARWDGRTAAALERVAATARLARPPRPAPPPPRRAMRGRHAIRHLFTQASKFHKNLRRYNTQPNLTVYTKMDQILPH